MATSQVAPKFLELVNKTMISSCSPLEEKDLFNENTLPLTVGTLSTKLILKYFNNVFLKGDLYHRICFFKLGILNPNSSKYQ